MLGAKTADRDRRRRTATGKTRSRAACARQIMQTSLKLRERLACWSDCRRRHDGRVLTDIRGKIHAACSSASSGFHRSPAFVNRARTLSRRKSSIAHAPRRFPSRSPASKRRRVAAAGPNRSRPASVPRRSGCSPRAPAPSGASPRGIRMSSARDGVRASSTRERLRERPDVFLHRASHDRHVDVEPFDPVVLTNDGIFSVVERLMDDAAGTRGRCSHVAPWPGSRSKCT